MAWRGERNRGQKRGPSGSRKSEDRTPEGGGHDLPADSSRPTPGWRHRAVAAGGSPFWRQATRKRLLDRGVTRRLKLAGYALLSLTLIGFLIAKILFVPKPTPVVSFTCAEYPYPFRPNALAAEDAALMQRLFAGYRNVRFAKASDTWGDKNAFLTDLERQLSQLQVGGPQRDTVIIHLSAHGMVDGQNEPCLILPTSQPLDSSSWVPMREVVTTIQRIPSLATSHVLLVLDAGKIQQDWQMGVIYSSFAERLEEVVSSMAVPQLAVILSAGVGQQSLLMPERGVSVFGLFLARGLRGEARGADNQVSLHELHRYLLEQVDGFARNHRAMSQQPVLIPADATDFPLVYVTGEDEPETKSLSWEDRLNDLDSRWLQMSRLADRRIYEKAPRDWAEAQRRLMQLESLLVAGQAYDGQYETNKALAGELLEKLASAETLLPVGEAMRLALAERMARLEPEKRRAAVASYQVWRNSQRSPPPAEPVPMPLLPWRLACQTAWDAVLAGTPDRRELEIALALADGAADRGAVDFAEIHFLRVLDRDLDWSGSAASRLGPLLSVQQRVEEATAPRDLRIQYWLDSLTRSVDRSVRSGWDEFFVGQDSSLDAAASHWKDLVDASTGSLARLIRIADIGVEAYRLRDEALATQIYYAAWASLFQQSFPQSARRSEGESLQLAARELIAHTTRLAHELLTVRDQDIAGDQLGSVIEQQEQVQQRLATLQSGLAEHCRQLWVENTNDQTTLRQIEIALQIPLLPGQDVQIRNDLRRRYFRQRFAETALRTSREAPDPVAVASSPDAEFLAAVTEAPHPALLLLDDQPLGVEPAPGIRGLGANLPPEVQGAASRSRQLQQVARCGEAIRESLRNADRLRGELVGQTMQQLESGGAPVDVRQGLAKADFVTRAAAAMNADQDGKTGDDASLQLAAFDAHFLFCWEASRALDDFWGPLDEGGTPYFAQQADHWLEAARRQFPAAVSYRRRLDALAKERVAAARSWLPLSAEALHFTADQPSVRHQVEVRAAPDLPQGAMAVFLERAAGETLAVTVEGDSRPSRRFRVDTNTNRSVSDLISNQPALPTASMDYVALFRGHRKPAAFFMDSGASATITSFIRPERSPSRIRVSGDALQTIQVVFVLDCSYSMRFKHRIENRTVSRMQLATDALSEIIRQSDSSGYYLGLVLYGHRAGWQGNQVRLRNPARDRGLHPSGDVEVLIPASPILRPSLVTGRMEDSRQDFLAALEGLRPFGETPLYYALTKAFEAFNPSVPGTRHIVVITDGVDRQSADSPANVKRDVADVRKLLAASTQETRIDIIGFRAEPDLFDSAFDEADWTKNERPRWNATERKNLEEISALSGGSFHDVTEPATLTSELRNSLQLAKYYVRARSAPESARDELDLAREWTAPPGDRPGEYVVGIVGQPQVSTILPLGGGEAFALTYNRRLQRLEHQRFVDEMIGSGVNVPTESPARYFVAPHIPKTIGRDEVWFRASVQNVDPLQLSQPPACVWAEFQPVLGDPKQSPAQALFAYDCELEPGRPVPVLRFRLSGWPAEAELAAMKMWFSPDENQFSVVPLNLSQSSRIPFSPDVTFEVQSRRASDGRLVVIVEEEHHAASANYPLWLRMVPAPDAVRHAFVDRAQRARHEFVFQDPTGLSQSNPRLEVTTSRDLKKKWIAAGPFEVELPR